MPNPDGSETREEWKARVASIQVPRQPHVEQRSAGGSTQTYHHSVGGRSARVDANVVIDAPVSIDFTADMDGRPPADKES